MTTIQRRNYPDDYQRDAVALVTEEAYSIAEAAGSLAVAANLLGRWQREYEAQAKGETPDQDEREQLKRLSRENRELRVEKEFLKKRPGADTGHRYP